MGKEQIDLLVNGRRELTGRGGDDLMNLNSRKGGGSNAHKLFLPSSLSLTWCGVEMGGSAAALFGIAPRTSAGRAGG